MKARKTGDPTVSVYSRIPKAWHDTLKSRSMEHGTKLTIEIADALAYALGFEPNVICVTKRVGYKRRGGAFEEIEP